MKAQQPTKEDVRKFMQSPRRKIAPPPTPEQIKTELGWHMIPSNAGYIK